jgi:tetratricopeptide (TPR) repeat protein
MPQDGMLALAKLQLCFQADPKNLETLALLARAFGAIGQAAKGIEVQKEMARLAKEQGKPELFRQLVDKLQRAAPNDEQVRALAMSGVDFPASIEPVIREAGPVRSRGSGQFEEVSYDSVDSGDFESAEPVTNGAAPATQEDSYDAAPDVLIDGDEVVPEGAGELSDAVVQLLADAASFRRVRLYLKAVETLHAGLELDPNSRAIREALRDVLLESRRYEEAAEEMISIASLQIHSGEIEGATQSLHDVLAVDPTHARAHELLQVLGVESREPGGYAPSSKRGTSAAKTWDRPKITLGPMNPSAERGKLLCRAFLLRPRARRSSRRTRAGAPRFLRSDPPPSRASPPGRRESWKKRWRKPTSSRPAGSTTTRAPFCTSSSGSTPTTFC